MEKYLAIYRLSFTHALKNYKVLIGLSIFLMTCMLIFANLWKVAAARIGVVEYSPEQLLWYIAFNEWVLISVPEIYDDMEQDLRSGLLTYLLPRPISYLGSVFAEAAGALTLNLIVLGIVTFLFTWYQVGVLPFPPLGFVFAVILGIGACLLGIIFQMIAGLSAFWLQEVEPFYWIWEKSLFLLGGLMLPLTIYPQWLQTIAHFTPFPAILGDRSALALDFSLYSVLSIAGSLIFWGIVGTACLLLTYRRGLKILNIEGG